MTVVLCWLPKLACMPLIETLFRSKSVSGRRLRQMLHLSSVVAFSQALHPHLYTHNAQLCEQEKAAVSLVVYAPKSVTQRVHIALHALHAGARCGLYISAKFTGLRNLQYCKVHRNIVTAEIHPPPIPTKLHCANIRPSVRHDDQLSSPRFFANLKNTN